MFFFFEIFLPDANILIQQLNYVKQKQNFVYIFLNQLLVTQNLFPLSKKKKKK